MCGSWWGKNWRIVPTRLAPRSFFSIHLSRDVVLGLGYWSLVVLKDKIAVLGPGLEIPVLCWVILSQQASSTMILAVVYMTWKCRLKPASNNRQHPAPSELRSVFAGYVCTCGTCSLMSGLLKPCVQIEHKCPTLCWKLWSSWNATVLFVCDVAQAQCNIWHRFMLQNWTLTNCDEL